jgi:hypothetical protein
MRGGTGARYPFLPPNRRWQRGGGALPEPKNGTTGQLPLGVKVRSWLACPACPIYH